MQVVVFFYLDCPGNGEEGGDDVRSVFPLHPGLETRYNGWYNAQRSREMEQIAPKPVPVRIAG
jgi:hypothetical protein